MMKRRIGDAMSAGGVVSRPGLCARRWECRTHSRTLQGVVQDSQTFRNRRSSDRIQHECTGDRRSVYGNLEGLTLTACLCRKRLSVFLPFWNNRPAERYARGPLAPTRARRVDREPEPGTRDVRESRERARPSDARVAPARRETARERARVCVPRPRVDPTGLLRGECRISNMSAPATRARGAAPTWDEEVDFPNEALQSETESDSAVSARRIAPRAPRSTPAPSWQTFSSSSVHARARSPLAPRARRPRDLTTRSRAL